MCWVEKKQCIAQGTMPLICSTIETIMNQFTELWPLTVSLTQPRPKFIENEVGHKSVHQ